MAIPVNIHELLNQRIVESTRIEYKADYNPTSVLHSICAFANDIDNVGGGYILIGVEEENGLPRFPVKGISPDRIDGILKKIREHCHFIEPLYEPVVEPVQYEGVYVIVVWVAGGYGRPYKAPKDATCRQSEKYYYVRKFSSSVIASSNEEKELFYVSTNIPFDDRENLAADVANLSKDLMVEHLREVESDLLALAPEKSALELAKDMKLVAGPPEHLKPLNVGLLMFSEQAEKYFRYARIEVVDIPDPTGSNMVERTFTGPIHKQLKHALAFIKSYTLAEAVIKDSNRAEATRIWNYPYRAVEEILANAVYHRSYQVSEPITVRITPEGMEITSFPGFDRSISDKQIEEYDIRARVYRNRRIGDFLKELHLIEGRNTGFPNALKALAANGSEPFRVEMDAERQYLSVFIPVHEYFRKPVGVMGLYVSEGLVGGYGRRFDADADLLKETAQYTALCPEKQIKPKQQAYYKDIILTVENEEHTLTEIAYEMNYKGISKRLRKAVDELCALGELKTVVSGSEVRYIKNTSKEDGK